MTIDLDISWVFIFQRTDGQTNDRMDWQTYPWKLSDQSLKISNQLLVKSAKFSNDFAEQDTWRFS